MTQTIDDTLAERGSRYGEFDEHASVTQAIKVAMSLGNNWLALDDDMKEALEMVAHKMGRILNGDPDYIDSWTDIIGYTRLVEKRLIAEQAAPKLRWGPEDECDCDVCQIRRNGLAKAQVSGVVGVEPSGQDPQEELASHTIDELYAHFVASLAKRAEPGKPSADEISAAVNLLMAAGVISLVEDGNT